MGLDLMKPLCTTSNSQSATISNPTLHEPTDQATFSLNLASLLQLGQIFSERNIILPRAPFPFDGLVTRTSLRVIRSVNRSFNAVSHSEIITINTTAPSAGLSIIYSPVFENSVAGEGHSVAAFEANEVGDHWCDRFGCCFRG